MADISDRPTLVPLNDTFAPYAIKEQPLWQKRFALAGILLLSIFMNFFQLGQNGYGNLYYASGVRSMADSWHNFFFVSLDPGGFVTVDKPPVGFWLQTLSVKLFGFASFSIFLPQALCGVLAVWLLYSLIRRHFGTGAGLIAALALAVSPISVVTDRNNTIDGTLALILLLAAWAVIRASESGKLRWLLLSGVFVGLGFNTKMSEAYLIIPALGMAYLFCAPRKIWTRLWHLAVVLIVMLVVSLSWAATVDMTAASQRPYVGSTKDNSEISLAVGYNGLNRLHIGDIGNATNNAPADSKPSKNNTTTGSGLFAMVGSNQLLQLLTGNTATPQPASNHTQTNAAQTNKPDPFRLFGLSYGGQIAWLLPFALLAIVALALHKSFNRRDKKQLLGLVLWGFWLLTMTVFFTLDSSFHQYYLTVMAPGLCALVGIGLIVMWREYCAGNWRGWLLPITLIITALTQIYILNFYPSWSHYLSPLIFILTALVAIALLLLRLLQRPQSSRTILRVASICVGVGIFALLITPTIWSTYSVMHNPESSAPIAGPGTQTKFSSLFVTSGQHSTTVSQANRALIAYLEVHQGNTKFLVATPGSSTADPLILATNRPIMPMGGFSGNDPILTLSTLQTLIHDGTIRFFLINAPRTTKKSSKASTTSSTAVVGQNALSGWISEHCKVVPKKDWQVSKGARTTTGGNQLYDCSSSGV